MFVLCKKFIIVFGSFLYLCLFAFAPSARADEGLSLIRDQEVEDALYSFTRPMFTASALAPDSLTIVLVKDNNINAFTAKGAMIFVNTGLITSSAHADEVIGVLAHETGHVAGGHLIRLYENMRIAQRNSLISTVLGGVAAIATGRPDVGIAVMMGAQSSVLGAHLAYRQGEENAADEMAAKILQQTNYSVKGFLEVMKRLIVQEKISLSNDYTSYLRTHPLSTDRVKFLENVLAREKPAPSIMHQQNELKFQRAKAKLIAFLYQPYRVMLIYPASDTSVAGRYARAIARYRMGELDEALALMDELIKLSPADPYFYELKGQMLFEHGRVAEALVPYAKAVKLAPAAALIRTSYAAALVETGTAENAGKAIVHLEKVLQTEADEPAPWRFLAAAANNKGDAALTSFAMAEYNFLIGNKEGARIQIDRAEKLLPKGSPKYLKLMDIKEALEHNSGDED